MTSFINTTFIFLFLLATSCTGTKNATSDNITTNTASDRGNSNTNMNNMDEEGFTMATITTSSVEGDCPVTLKITQEDGSILYFDPINLEESFAINGKVIWVKYKGLRMMNRCENANPIEIIGVKERN